MKDAKFKTSYKIYLKTMKRTIRRHNKSAENIIINKIIHNILTHTKSTNKKITFCTCPKMGYNTYRKNRRIQNRTKGKTVLRYVLI